jgi:hypothetical protein
MQYVARIIYVFWRHTKDVNRFLETNGSINRNRFLRLLSLGCLDIFLTFPIGILNILVQTDTVFVDNPAADGTLPFYISWEETHSDWSPITFLYADIVAAGRFNVFAFYFSPWSTVVVGIVIFALFGLTPDARVTYWRGILLVGKCLGLKPQLSPQAELGEIEFGAQPTNTGFESQSEFVHLSSSKDDDTTSRLRRSRLDSEVAVRSEHRKDCGGDNKA